MSACRTEFEHDKFLTDFSFWDSPTNYFSDCHIEIQALQIFFANKSTYTYRG